MSCKSLYEIRVFAQRRSGHHAISNWIIGHFKGPVLFINDFTSLNKKESKKNTLTYNMGKKQINFEKNKKIITRKECLLYNLEEEDLLGIYKKLETRKHIYPISSGKKIIDILVIRDPYNMFASRFEIVNKVWPANKFGKKYNQKIKAWNGNHSVLLWKVYAKEYLNETDFLKNNKLVINYNLWFSDINYRKKISKILGLKFTDSGLNFVPQFGKGSSFDSRSFNNKGQDMKVLERWKLYHGKNKEYDKIFEDQELVELSSRVFGEPPFK